MVRFESYFNVANIDGGLAEW